MEKKTITKAWGVPPSLILFVLFFLVLLSKEYFTARTTLLLSLHTQAILLDIHHTERKQNSDKHMKNLLM